MGDSLRGGHWLRPQTYRGVSRPIRQRLVAGAVRDGQLDSTRARRQGGSSPAVPMRREHEVVGRRPADPTRERQVRPPGPGLAGEAERLERLPRAARRPPGRPPERDSRHRDQHLGLRPELEALERELDRRPGPLPADFDQRASAEPGTDPRKASVTCRLPGGTGWPATCAMRGSGRRGERRRGGDRPATAQKKASACGHRARSGAHGSSEALEGCPDRLPPHGVTAAAEPERRRVDAHTPAPPIAPADPDGADGLGGAAAGRARDARHRDGMVRARIPRSAPRTMASATSSLTAP